MNNHPTTAPVMAPARQGAAQDRRLVLRASTTAGACSSTRHGACFNAKGSAHIEAAFTHALGCSAMHPRRACVRPHPQRLPARYVSTARAGAPARLWPGHAVILDWLAPFCYETARGKLRAAQRPGHPFLDRMSAGPRPLRLIASAVSKCGRETSCGATEKGQRRSAANSTEGSSPSAPTRPIPPAPLPDRSSPSG